MKRTSSDNSLNRKPAARPRGNPAENNITQRDNLPPTFIQAGRHHWQNRNAQAAQIIDLTDDTIPHQILPVASLPNNNQELNNHGSGYTVINVTLNNSSLDINDTSTIGNQPRQGNTGGKDINAMLERLIANTMLEFSQAPTQTQPQPVVQPEVLAEEIQASSVQDDLPPVRQTREQLELKKVASILLNFSQQSVSPQQLQPAQHVQPQAVTIPIEQLERNNRNVIVLDRSSVFKDNVGRNNFRESLKRIGKNQNLKQGNKMTSRSILNKFLEENPEITFYVRVKKGKRNFRKLDLTVPKDLHIISQTLNAYRGVYEF